MRAGMRNHRFHELVLVVLVLAACADGGTRNADAPAQDDPVPAVTCGEDEVRALVATFGQRLRQVSVLAPDSIVEREMRTAYGTLATQELLNRWIAAPRTAPGREVSSPWPQRIDVVSVVEAGTARCRVAGEIVLVTGTGNGSDTEVAREPVTLELKRQADGWRVSRFTRTAADGAAPDDPGAAAEARAATAVLERYYRAIQAGDHRTAYRLWGGEGAASGQSYEQFARGYAHTQDVALEIGAAERVEGAAGSRYITLSVVIQARTTAGDRQRFGGTYTLRRSVVDGAAPDEREWRIHSAQISAAPAAGPPGSRSSA